jgi:AAHS family 4-hydroxybenzoate transporter-like MFS transporter
MTALATNFTQLLICRLLTGAGLAGALANAISLVAEYAPRRIRVTVVSVMFGAFPLGGALGGLVSAKMIQGWGWPSMFWVGGAMPIALGCLLANLLPESIKFLVATGSDPRKTANVLNRLVGRTAFRGDELFVIAEAARRGAVREIFSSGYALKTVLLWIAFAVNQITLTFAITWMPLVLRRAGAPLSQAIVASAVYTLVGLLGAVVIARFADRAKCGRPVAWAYFFSALAMSAIGYAASTPWLLYAVVSVAGFFVVGVAVNLNPIAAAVYATPIRSTGVGWALAAKSAGGIAGALAGSLLVSSRFSIELLYLTAAIPVVIGATSLARLVSHTITHDTALIVQKAVPEA